MMTRLMQGLAIAIGVFGLVLAEQALLHPRVAHAQTETRYCTTANATSTINAQATVTLTPPLPDQFVYLCSWDVTASQNASATANTNLKFTSTNIGGWSWQYSLGNTANTTINQGFYFTGYVRATTVGTAVTIVSPAAVANTAFSINVSYFYGN